jgi:hypothetical protein
MSVGIVLNRTRQVPAEDTPAFGAIAERFRRGGDLARAVELCREGLRKFPDHLSARVTLGWALLDQGQYEEARAELEQVLKRAPDNLAAIRGLAELHDRAENTVELSLAGPGPWPPDQTAIEGAPPADSTDVMAGAGEIAPQFGGPLPASEVPVEPGLPVEPVTGLGGMFEEPAELPAPQPVTASAIGEIEGFAAPSAQAPVLDEPVGFVLERFEHASTRDVAQPAAEALISSPAARATEPLPPPQPVETEAPPEPVKAKARHKRAKAAPPPLPVQAVELPQPVRAVVVEPVVTPAVPVADAPDPGQEPALEPLLMEAEFAPSEPAGHAPSGSAAVDEPALESLLTPAALQVEEPQAAFVVPTPEAALEPVVDEEIPVPVAASVAIADEAPLASVAVEAEPEPIQLASAVDASLSDEQQGQAILSEALKELDAATESLGLEEAPPLEPFEPVLLIDADQREIGDLREAVELSISAPEPEPVLVAAPPPPAPEPTPPPAPKPVRRPHPATKKLERMLQEIRLRRIQHSAYNPVG